MTRQASAELRITLNIQDQSSQVAIHLAQLPLSLWIVRCYLALTEIAGQVQDVLYDIQIVITTSLAQIGRFLWLALRGVVFVCKVLLLG